MAGSGDSDILRELFDGSPDAIFVEDVHGKVLDVNPDACALHGMSRDDAVSSTGEPKRDRSLQGTGLVLLADDDETVRTVGLRMLQRLGFEAIGASDGTEAVESFRARGDEVCCVVLDMSMPRKDGVEAMGEIRKIRPDVPIVLSSGFDEQELAECVPVADSPSGYLHKPYSLSDLADVMNKALGPVLARLTTSV